MKLTFAQLAELVALARADAPREACGLIAARRGRACKIYPLKNVDGTPEVRYLGDPQQQFDALREIEDKGWEVGAIFHSHPASPAYPSPTDVERAYYPDALYLLISLLYPVAAQVRAFRIQEGQVKEETLEIEP